MTYQKKEETEVCTEIVDTVKRHIPKAKFVTKKESLIHRFFNLLDPGWLKSDMIGVGGFTVGFPETFSGFTDNTDSLSILVHEITHLRQNQKYTRFLFWVLFMFPWFLGIVFILSSALMPWVSVRIVLVGFGLVFFHSRRNWFRWKMEEEAFVMGLAVHYWKGYEIGDAQFLYIAELLTSPTYTCIGDEIKAFTSLKTKFQKMVLDGGCLKDRLIWDIYMVLVRNDFVLKPSPAPKF